MVRAIIFDCFGVLTTDKSTKNNQLLSYIKDLKQHYKIGLLSNISSDWLRQSFLSDKEVRLFDDILLSYEVHMTKSDPRIYHLTAHRLGVHSNECVLIDDIQQHCNIAKAEGMGAILYENYLQTKQALELLLATNTNH